MATPKKQEKPEAAPELRTRRLVRVSVRLPRKTAREAELAQKDAHEWAVIGLWRDGHISTREAAAILEVSYHEYLDLLTRKKVPVLSDDLLDADEVDQMVREIKAAKG